MTGGNVYQLVVESEAGTNGNKNSVLEYWQNFGQLVRGPFSALSSPLSIQKDSNVGPLQFYVSI